MSLYFNLDKPSKMKFRLDKMKSRQLLRTLLFLLFFALLLNNQVKACNINASFTYTDSAGFLKFANTSTGGNRLIWNFGNGAKFFNNYVYFKAQGTYTVELKVMDTLNMTCYDTFSTQITTGGVCWLKANFQFNESSTVLNRVYFSFASNFLGDVNYWSYGDGKDSNINFDHNHDFENSGTYQVWLKTAQSGIQGCVDSISKSVYLESCRVKADFDFIDKGNLNVQFVNTSIFANKYNWRLGDGKSFAIKEFWHLFPDDGTYNVKLIAKQTGKELCADTIIKRVFGYSCRIKAGFTHSFTGDVRNRDFINLSRSATFFQWDFGDTTYSGMEFPNHKYARTGIYNVKLMVYDTGFSSCADTFSTDIGAYACNVKAKIGFYDSLGFVKYTSLSTGSNKNYWNVYTSVPFTRDSLYVNEFSKQFTSCKSVNMYLTSYDTLALCSDFASMQGNIRPLVPEFEVVADTNNNYAGYIIDRSKYSINANYLWDFGDGDTSTSKTPTHTYSGSGPYKLCLTLTGANCNLSWCDTVEFDTSGRLKRSFKPFTIKVVTEDQLNTSIIKPWSATIIKIYPNPFVDVLKIESEQIMRSARIIRIDGSLLQMKDVNGSEVEFNTKDLRPGIYLLEMEMENGSKIYRRLLRS